MAALKQRQEISDLSLLSMLAAHELERLQRSEPSDRRYLSELRNRLEEQIAGPEQHDVRNIAPSTVSLYRRAVQAATMSDPEDFATLNGEVSKLLEELKTISELPGEIQDQAILQRMSSFVSAIHRTLLAQKQRTRMDRHKRRFRV